MNMDTNGLPTDLEDIRTLLAELIDRVAEVNLRLARLERNSGQAAAYRPPAPCGKQKLSSGGLPNARPGWNGNPKCTKPSGHDGWCSWANQGMRA